MKTGLRLQCLFVITAALAVPAPQACAQAEKPLATKSGFVTSADGAKIHYIEAGQGPAILFVPGFTAPGWMWEKQITHFAKTHRVVAMAPARRANLRRPRKDRTGKMSARNRSLSQ
jgi:hypothetical protein